MQWDFRSEWHIDDLVASIHYDAVALHNQRTTPHELARAKLWPLDRRLAPGLVMKLWGAVARILLDCGEHWRVWIDWYEHILEGSLRSEAWEKAFTGLTGPWDDGPEGVNTQIGARLAALESREMPLHEESYRLT